MFIDGENLVFRFEDLIKKGRIKVQEVHHKIGVYVWHEMTYHPGPDHVIRVYYYASAEGAEDVLERITADMKCKRFTQNPHTRLSNTLFPQLFKKIKGQKSKGVDIQLTTDLLQHAYGNNFDIACIFTGDADFLPAIEEVMRVGKSVFLGAFSSGLSPKLRNKVDRFIDLDDIYFEPLHISNNQKI